jgi:hypothetical protein
MNSLFHSAASLSAPPSGVVHPGCPEASRSYVAVATQQYGQLWSIRFGRGLDKRTMGVSVV